MIARLLPKSIIVKAFDAILATDLVPDSKPELSSGRRAIPIAGDDAGAKSIASGLINDFGYDNVDTGRLSEGYRFAPGTLPSELLSM